MVDPKRLFEIVSRRMPVSTRYVADSGPGSHWSTRHLNPPRPGSYHMSMSAREMPWGIGFSIGLAFGAPNTPVVCFTCDNGFLVAGQELTTAAAQGLPVICFVLNSSASEEGCGGAEVGASVSGRRLVNSAGLAASMGIESMTVNSSDDLEAVDFESIAIKKGPTLIEVCVDTGVG